MGGFVETSGQTEADLQAFILGSMSGLSRGAVVSVVPIITRIRSALPDCRLSSHRLAKLVSETAMLLGLVPVVNPAFKESDQEPNRILGLGRSEPYKQISVTHRTVTTD
ncbi:MAG: hypothetical protein AB1440_01095 [Pseudomonadota bacterium]|jgi:hypothetical protein